MKEEYTQFISESSQRLADLLLAELPKDELKQVQFSDQAAALILREIGQAAMRALFARLSEQVTQAAKSEGYKIERRPVIRIEVLFGAIEFPSPYLRNATGHGTRPVFDRLKVKHASRTPAVERALTDFGVEESFAQASVRFHEHYGFEIGSSTLCREVEAVGAEAESYLTERIEAARQDYEVPLRQRRGVAELLVELDGCEIRTVLCSSERETLTGELKRQRKTEWKEVRVGLAGRIGSSARSYVAKLSSYPEICGDLFSAAISEGLSPRTLVVAVADGGQGLMEELQVHFPKLQFILDKPHLSSHLYETAEALGFGERQRASWVEELLQRISGGKVQSVIAEFLRKRTRCQRLRRLTGYLQRFQAAVFYDEYLAKGYPIGSGEVESAHRYIPQKRLKIAGASWLPKTVNQMLALRVIRANGWWEDFWKQRQVAFLAH